MSFVLHRRLGSAPPRAIRGEGLILHLSDGSQVIDASGGAAVACLGHGDARVTEAMARQTGAMAYVHTGFFSSEPAEALASLLVGQSPGGLCRAYFVSSGSEAMEAAMKLARQYFVEIGEPARDLFVSRRLSYHGNTLGALAISGHAARRGPYDVLLNERHIQISPCFPFRFQGPSESEAQYVDRLATELEDALQAADPNRVIAFVAEPVVGATTGAVTPTVGYFKAMREVCDRYGVLLILDEVMCGMGRTGTTHAWEQEGVAPDIQTVGKALGGGYQPIAGVLVGSKVIGALESGSGLFIHGQTYQAHPVACAAALEVQSIIKRDNLLENVIKSGEYMGRKLRERFSSHPNVGDIRGRGLFWALEFVADRSTNRPFARDLAVSEILKQESLKNGLAIYPGSGTIDGTKGDHLLLAPPYWLDQPMIDVIVDKLGVAVDRATTNLR